MKRAALCTLPYLAAFGVPAAVIGVLYTISGESPLLGLFGGIVGLFGALLMLATRLLIQDRLQETRLDKALEWLRKEQESQRHDCDRSGRYGDRAHEEQDE